MIELVINWKKVRRLGFIVGWFKGDPFALFEFAILRLQNGWIDLLYMKILKLEVNLFFEISE